MNTVYISSEIEKEGKVDLIYLMDKEDVAVAKNNEVIFTSHDLDTSIKIMLVNLINETYQDDIKDTLDIFGIVFYKKNFEKALGLKIKNFNDLISKMSLGKDDENNSIKSINKNNESKFDIDEILDKINQQGMNSLSREEREFLQNSSGK